MDFNYFSQFANEVHYQVHWISLTTLNIQFSKYFSQFNTSTSKACNTHGRRFDINKA